MLGPMDDLATSVLLAASVFFAVLGIALLFRYRQVSQRISASSDLGRDLWEALESRLKKQDERILDMVGKMEVIQARVLEKPVGSKGMGGVFSLPTELAEPEERRELRDVVSRSALVSDFGSAVESRLNQQGARIVDLTGRLEAIQSLLAEAQSTKRPTTIQLPVRPVSPTGDSTEKLVVEMLQEKARTSVEIRQRFNISREHAARLLKGLFDKGLVSRNDSGKPFVYELTDAGRRYLSAG